MVPVYGTWPGRCVNCLYCGSQFAIKCDLSRSKMRFSPFPCYLKPFSLLSSRPFPTFSLHLLFPSQPTFSLRTFYFLAIFLISFCRVLSLLSFCPVPTVSLPFPVVPTLLVHNLLFLWPFPTYHQSLSSFLRALSPPPFRRVFYFSTLLFLCPALS